MSNQNGFLSTDRYQRKGERLQTHEQFPSVKAGGYTKAKDSETQKNRRKLQSEWQTAEISRYYLLVLFLFANITSRMGH